MKHTISVLVENNAGVLSRISGLFSRRGFNIDSLAVGVTEDPDLSRMTIVVNGDDYVVEQIEKQLNKLIETIKVKEITEDTLIARELALIKVAATTAQRADIMNVVKIMKAKITDISRSSVTVEICDTPENIALITDLLRPYTIREIVRTGTVAIEKGADTISGRIVSQGGAHTGLNFYFRLLQNQQNDTRFNFYYAKAQ